MHRRVLHLAREQFVAPFEPACKIEVANKAVQKQHRPLEAVGVKKPEGHWVLNQLFYLVKRRKTLAECATWIAFLLVPLSRLL